MGIVDGRCVGRRWWQRGEMSDMVIPKNLYIGFTNMKYRHVSNGVVVVDIISIVDRRH